MSSGKLRVSLIFRSYIYVFLAIPDFFIAIVPLCFTKTLKYKLPSYLLGLLRVNFRRPLETSILQGKIVNESRPSKCKTLPSRESAPILLIPVTILLKIKRLFALSAKFFNKHFT